MTEPLDNKEFDGLVKELDDKTDEVGELLEKIDELESELADVKGENILLEGRLNVALARNRDLDEQNCSLQGDLSETMCKLRKEQSENFTLYKTIAKLGKALDHFYDDRGYYNE